MNITRSIARVVMGFLAITTIAGTFTSTPAWAGRRSGSSITPLSTSEAQHLTHMREEEKLARDVYLTMYEKWGVAIFSNIKNSEQRHMATMKKMLDKYGLPDPALPGVGDFKNMQSEYDYFVEQGSSSYIDALEVGATIEDLDIADIQQAMDDTSHIDLLNAYQNLLEGSKNHLRAYVRALQAQGISYVPQYIDQELFDAIIGL